MKKWLQKYSRLKFYPSTVFCTRLPGVEGRHFDMLSILRRFVQQGVLFRQRIFNRKLEFGQFGGRSQQAGENPVANTKYRSGTTNASNPANQPSNALTPSHYHGANREFLQNILETVAGTVREVFITNVLKRGARANWANQVFKSRPVYGLVGLGLTVGVNPLNEYEEFEKICTEIRNTLRHKTEDSVVDQEVHTHEENVIEFKDYLSKGQCGAVYEARLKNEDVAVKVMFNYSLQSNASTILKGMMKELVPYKKTIPGLNYGDVKRCGPHPNVVNIKDIIVSNNVPLPGSREHWPDALPTGMNGFGRNMTLHIVMEKYDSDLRTFLDTHSELVIRDRILIFSQMLEGIAFLRRQGIAHRDLKCDNFLVKVMDYPHVVITDFGCCLASKKNPMQLAYSSDEVDIGGNQALQAPEIVRATPGTFKWLSYEKSDLWAVGAIAYEVFGHQNPFYTTLEPQTYSEDDLPELNLPKGYGNLEEMVKNLLCEKPSSRMNAEVAAIICYIYLWGPKSWWNKGKLQLSELSVLQWLMLMTRKAVSNTSETNEANLITTFLQRVSFRQVQDVVRFCQ